MNSVTKQSLQVTIGSVVLLLLAGIVGAEVYQGWRKQSEFPPGATRVTDLGNYWYEFEYRGRVFLYRDRQYDCVLTEMGKAE